MEFWINAAAASNQSLFLFIFSKRKILLLHRYGPLPSYLGALDAFSQRVREHITLPAIQDLLRTLGTYRTAATSHVRHQLEHDVRRISGRPMGAFVNPSRRRITTSTSHSVASHYTTNCTPVPACAAYCEAVNAR